MGDLVAGLLEADTWVELNIAEAVVAVVLVAHQVEVDNNQAATLACFEEAAAGKVNNFEVNTADSMHSL